ncbi:hypothetical protein NSP_45000 [Nodularia spumigena CCY9414]|nr:hypothetical protein NSP_45000 [Nodularia spumigena CCY9414]
MKIYQEFSLVNSAKLLFVFLQRKLVFLAHILPLLCVYEHYSHQ